MEYVVCCLLSQVVGAVMTFIQDHTDLNHENNDNNAHQVCCEDSPTKGIYIYIYAHCQSDDLDLHLRSQVRLKFDYVLTCNISDNI